MSSRASTPLPPSLHRSFLSPLHRPVGARRVLLALFLPIAAVFALPSLGIGALIWWRASKTWDSRERWSGTRLMAVIGLLVYGFVSWFYHPCPRSSTPSRFICRISPRNPALMSLACGGWGSSGCSTSALRRHVHSSWKGCTRSPGEHACCRALPRESRERPEEMGLPIQLHSHTLLRTVSDRHALHQFSHLHREPPQSTSLLLGPRHSSRLEHTSAASLTNGCTGASCASRQRRSRCMGWCWESRASARPSRYSGWPPLPHGTACR